MYIAGKTDIGRVRQENQDNFRAGRLSCGISFAFVCDGMGGAQGGKYASSLLSCYLEQELYTNLPDLKSSGQIKPLMLGAVAEGNELVYASAQKDENKKGMGTTAVMCVISDNIAHIINVGDSRCYILRNGVLTQLTRDHSIVQDLVECGTLSAEQARRHPKKNLITRAVGVASHVQADYLEYPVSPGDMLLLCSDGLTSCVDDSAIQIVLQNSGFYDIVDKLIKLAKSGGGQDNITAVVMAVPK